MPFGIGHWELIALGVVLVLLFGTSRVPTIARQLGRGVRELRDSVAAADPRTPLRELDRPESRSDAD
jgi:sec-independent protein translocase protein TatA